MGHLKDHCNPGRAIRLGRNGRSFGPATFVTTNATCLIGLFTMSRWTPALDRCFSARIGPVSSAARPRHSHQGTPSATEPGHCTLYFGVDPHYTTCSSIPRRIRDSIRFDGGTAVLSTSQRS